MYPHPIRLRGPWEYATGDGESAIAGKLTVPGFWHDQGVRPRGKITLRRWFHWVNKPASDEAIWLCLDRCVGRVTVRLNGEVLGTHENPWDDFRFDVSCWIGMRNQLELEIEPLCETTWNSALAVLSLATENTDSSHPVGGVLGGVHLSVESRKVSVMGLSLATGLKDNIGTIQLNGWIQSSQETSRAASIELLLDGRLVAQTEVELPDQAEAKVPWELQASSRNVLPWWPRSLGEPSLHELVLHVTVGGVTFEKVWRVGFRDLSWEPRVGYICNGRHVPVPIETITAARTFQPYFGEDPKARFEDWRMAQSSVLHVAGHFPPESLYDLCDRAGLLIEQELPPRENPQTLPSSTIVNEHASMLDRLQSHPSFARICEEDR